MLKFHMKRFRNGWSIPRSMEWLFWPIGYKTVQDEFERAWREGDHEGMARAASMGAGRVPPIERRFVQVNLPGPGG